jgi:hypothetical protein
MSDFIHSVDGAAWRLERARPTIVLIWQGQPTLQDAATYAQALLPGQILRVVADSWELLAGLERWCEDQGLSVVGTSQVRDVPLYGFYGQCYVDIQRADTTAASL